MSLNVFTKYVDMKVISCIKIMKYISIWPWVEKWFILKSFISVKASSLSFGASGEHSTGSELSGSDASAGICSFRISRSSFLSS